MIRRQPARAPVVHTLARLLAITAVSLGGLLTDTAAAADDPPNILLIIADDLGYGDLACQGAEDMRTPHLDGLFAESLKLNRFYANCPVCSPTRAAVMTGCYPDRVGVPGVIRTHASNNWGYFAPIAATLPERLAEQGYETMAVGKWHLGLRAENHPMSRGFDRFQGFLGDMMDDYFTHRRHGNNYMRQGRTEIDPEGHATDLFTAWAETFVRDRGNETVAGSDPSSPWFLYLAYNAPHTPIQPPENWLAKVKEREPGIDDRRAALVALIEHMDAGIGDVLDAVRESGQADDTVIVFTSDNGGQLGVGANNGPLRDGKGSMYEGGLRVPACIRVPGRTRPGSSSNAILATIDLMPTLAELAGGTAAEVIDGVSFTELLDNPDAERRVRDLYFVRREGGRRYSGLTIEAVRYGDYKLVHNLPTADLELFNLAEDPGETTDLADQRPRVTGEMIRRLQRHVQAGGETPWQKSDH